jgi:hypothetical protein
MGLLIRAADLSPRLRINTHRDVSNAALSHCLELCELILRKWRAFESIFRRLRVTEVGSLLDER